MGTAVTIIVVLPFWSSCNNHCSISITLLALLASLTLLALLALLASLASLALLVSIALLALHCVALHYITLH